jgi:hypothetical protein
MMRTDRISVSLSILALCMLAFPVAALADDAGLATKLLGKWEGQWEMPGTNMKGNLTIKITAAKGNTVDGETMWFRTSVGDVPDHFSGATVKGRRLKANGKLMDFVVTVSEDGMSIEGKWNNHAIELGATVNGGGPIKLKKVE